MVYTREILQAMHRSSSRASYELPRLADLISRYRKRSKTRFPWQYRESFAGNTLRGLQLIGAESRMAGRLETSK